MSLIVTGTIGIDTVHTPTGKAEKTLGGSATYFAAAASFYTKVRLVAAAGEDFPEKFRKVLAGFKRVDATGLEVRKGSKTFAWGGKYRADMNSRDTLFTELGVLGERPPAVPKKFADSTFVFLANSHPGVQVGFLEQLPECKLAVADTMDLWINTARGELEKLLKRVDGLVLNYDEAELFTGKKNPVTAARQVLAEFGGKGGKAGPARDGKVGRLKFVVVKKGEHGCIVVHRDGVAALPAYPAEEVVDPTGAGDSFAGGLMGALASSKGGHKASLGDVLVAASHGTVVASFNIESFSLGRLQSLKAGELKKRHKAFAKMVRVG
jgi:sugar/nucleoside kinase (ribokinase family)